MPLFYSAAIPGFYDDAIHDALPADAVPISAARHRELLVAQADGAAIEPGEDGKPRIRRPVITVAARRAALVRKVKREAARRIEAIAPVWRQVNDQRTPSDQGAARFAAIDAVRAASGLIEADIAATAADSLATFDVAAHALWPSE